MSWQYTGYSLILLAAGAASLVVAAWAWRHRRKRGAATFIALSGSLALWAFADALQLASTTLPAKLAFRTLGYVGHNLVPVLVVVFALTYVGRHSLLSRRTVAVLALEPMAVALVVTPTNALGWHGLVWRDVGLHTVDGVVLLSRTFGPWYWLNTAYNYLLVGVAVALFVRIAREGNESTRNQGLALLAAAIPPFAANVLWVAGLTRIDYTPVAFVSTSFAFGIALVRYRLLDVVPVAREVVLDELTDPYLVLDEADRIVDCNDTARALLPDGESVVGRPIGAAFPDLGGDPASWAGLAVEGPDGRRHFEVRPSDLEFGGRLLFLQDVTERRSVERRFRALIENASDLIAVLDAEGRFTYLSPSAERILGYEPAELVGTTAFDIIHPEDRGDARERFRQNVEEGDGPTVSEYRVERGDGTWIWLASRGRALFDDPAVNGYVVNARDVTDRKQRERTLERQNERLESLARVAAHDLRNPLNIIGGYVDLARETGDERYFEAIQEATDRMDELVDDLLVLARRGQLVEETEPVELADVATDAWEMVPTPDATVRLEVDGAVLLADRSRLRSLFENLFGNAVEHGGSTVTVRVGATPTGFFVEDDGTGIASADPDRLFERGYSTEPGGTGLGLPIVEGIATAHGWDLSLAESADGGVRVEVRGVEWATDEVAP